MSHRRKSSHPMCKTRRTYDVQENSADIEVISVLTVNSRDCFCEKNIGRPDRLMLHRRGGICYFINCKLHIWACIGLIDSLVNCFIGIMDIHGVLLSRSLFDGYCSTVIIIVFVKLL